MTARKDPTDRRSGVRWGVMVLVAVMLGGGVAAASVKVPADSTTPTSGYCTSESGRVATVRLGVDGPSVRCLQARRGQRLQVVNRTGHAMMLRWADRSVALHSGAAVTFPRPMGSYLAPGDHRISGPRYYSAEVWMPGRVAAPAPTAAG